MRGWRAGIFGLVPLLLVAAACERSPELSGGNGAGELETVEVAPAPDATASLAADEVEVRRAGSGLAGVLPSDFPRDLPLPLPASLIDIERGGGEVAIVLATAAGCDGVLAAHRSRMLAAGWFEEAPGSYRQEGRRAVVSGRDSRPGCHVRIAIRGN